jgi:ABC-type branched-subunit amino acid transport system substrate-binding protein
VRLRGFASLCAVLGVAVILPACGGDDSGSAATTTSVATSSTGAASTTASSGTSAPGAAAPTPTSIEAWEALWKTQRDAVVKRIKDNGWGTSADGTKVTGPEGFSIDLTKCPSGWSNTEGLTDTSIKIGYALPQSGPAASGGGLAPSENAVFKHYAAASAFKDSNGKTRTVDLVTRDDGYDPARTIPLVDEFLDSEKVFAMQVAGSAPMLKTYDKINQRCVPMPLPSSGHPAVGDPVNHPWTTSATLPYATEAAIWVAFAEQHLSEFGGKMKVAALKINNDFGAVYDNSFKAYLAASPHKADISYEVESFDPSAATVVDPMTTLAAGKPDMFITMTTGVSCSQALSAAAENGMKEEVKYKFFSAACKVTAPVTRDKVGDASADWWATGGGFKDISAAAGDKDPWIVAARQWLADAGLGYKDPIYNQGLYFGWTLAQSMMIAGELNGGLNRTNLMVAMRAIDMTHPQFLEGIKFNMNGNADAFFLEGSDVSQWSVAEQAWQMKSLIDLTGKTKNCAWDQAANSCR